MPCDLGVYEPEVEEQRQIVIREKNQVTVSVVARKIKRKVALIRTKPDEFWQWWARTSPRDPQNRERDVNLGGRPELGGGSKNGRKKKPLKKMAEYLKTWGKEN
jgi:hypothetical protein